MMKIPNFIRVENATKNELEYEYKLSRFHFQTINSSQLAKMKKKKKDSLHVPAIKFKGNSWPIKFQLYFKN